MPNVEEAGEDENTRMNYRVMKMLCIHFDDFKIVDSSSRCHQAGDVMLLGVVELDLMK